MPLYYGRSYLKVHYRQILNHMTVQYKHLISYLMVQYRQRNQHSGAVFRNALPLLYICMRAGVANALGKALPYGRVARSGDNSRFLSLLKII
jgi:hypothetical protein